MIDYRNEIAPKMLGLWPEFFANIGIDVGVMRGQNSKNGPCPLCGGNGCPSCAKCGYDKHVELCHIKDIANFDDDSLLSEVNSRNNIIQLCPNCHWEFDNGYRDNFIELLKNLNKVF